MDCAGPRLCPHELGQRVLTSGRLSIPSGTRAASHGEGSRGAARLGGLRDTAGSSRGHRLRAGDAAGPGGRRHRSGVRRRRGAEPRAHLAGGGQGRRAGLGSGSVAIRPRSSREPPGCTGNAGRPPAASSFRLRHPSHGITGGGGAGLPPATRSPAAGFVRRPLSGPPPFRLGVQRQPGSGQIGTWHAVCRKCGNKLSLSLGPKCCLAPPGGARCDRGLP